MNYSVLLLPQPNAFRLVTSMAKSKEKLSEGKIKVNVKCKINEINLY